MPKLETEGRERCTEIYKESTIERDLRAPEQTDADCENRHIVRLLT